MRNCLAVVLATFVMLDSARRGDSAQVAIAWNDVRAGTGMLGAIQSDAPWGVSRAPIPIGMDSILKSAFGKLYVLSQSERNVRVVNPMTWTIERTYPLDFGDTPVDIHVAHPQLAYISRRNATRLLQLDLISGALNEGADLGLFADGDGIPEQGTMAAHDGRLFVQLQRTNFDEPPPFPQPLLAVVDADSGQIIDVDPVRDGLQAIELAGTFPKMKMQVVEESRQLFVSSTGAFFDEGGIEVIDLEELQTQGLAIREADHQTGADLGAFVMVRPDRGFLTFSTDLLLSSHLHQFSLTGGVEIAELAVALDYFSPTIEFDPGTDSVFLPIGGSLDNGLLVFDAETGSRLSEQLIATSGPPTDLILLVAVPEPETIGLALVAAMSLTTLLSVRRSFAESTIHARIDETAPLQE